MNSEKCTLTLRSDYSPAQLYRILEKIPFAAGHPLLVHRRRQDLIIWPQLDAMNQVQIQKKKGSFYCVRSCRPISPARQDGNPGGTLFRHGPAAFLEERNLNRCDCDAMALRIVQQINALEL